LTIIVLFLLQTAAAAAQEKKVKEGKGKDKKKRKSRKSDIKKGHEDECYRCGEGGELIMCDRNGCPKVYHLNCLKLSKPPHGKYYLTRVKRLKEAFPLTRGKRLKGAFPLTRGKRLKGAFPFT